MSTVERAFELAKSGKFQKIDQIRTQLKREGCAGVDEHLSGFSLRAQLKASLASVRVGSKID